MQRLLPLYIGFLLCLIPSQAVRAEQPIWADEFDGDTLDYSKWECEVNAFGGGNNELQMYTDSKKNVRVESGLLILEAIKERVGISGTERDYSSARIRSKNRGDWKYGRVEVRAKLPRGQGIWPAIWMLPTDEKYGGWALSGEIDIMEFRGQNISEVLGTIHYGGKWPNNKFTSETYKLKSGNFVDDFHLYQFEWRKDHMTWSVDGKNYSTIKDWSSDGSAFPAPFDQRFHLLLNLAVGGQFLGNPDATTQFPQQFQVDYVRVFE